MDTALRTDRSQANGKSHADPSRSVRLASDPQQSSLFADPRPSVLGFLRALIGPHFKEVACALCPQLSVEQACAQLSRNLSGHDKRKIGTHEIDTVLDVLGADAEDAWWSFCLRRRGYKRPEREQNPVLVQQEIADIRRGIADLTDAAKKLGSALERVEGAMR